MMKGYRLQVTGYTLLFFVLLSTVHCTLYPIYAAESTPSSNLSNDLKTKLDEFLKQSATKAAQFKQEISRKLMDKAYVGTLKSKNENSLTLACATGAKIVTVNQDTVFESKLKTKQKFSLKTLSEGDHIAALGDIDDNGVLTARKIVLLTQPANIKTYLWGQIVSMSDKLITIQTRQSKNVAVSFSQDNLKLRDFVIMTGTIGKNDIFQAEFIYVISQGGVIKPKKIATPSARLDTTIESKRASPKR